MIIDSEQVLRQTVIIGETQESLTLEFKRELNGFGAKPAGFRAWHHPVRS